MGTIAVPIFLFPTLEFVFQLRNLTAVEHRFLDAASLLTAIVIEEAEHVAAEQNNGHEVAKRQEGHEEIDDVPYQFETGQGTEDHHHTT